VKGHDFRHHFAEHEESGCLLDGLLVAIHNVEEGARISFMPWTYSTRWFSLAKMEGLRVMQLYLPVYFYSVSTGKDGKE
jgi:hypothetical protein